MTIPSPDDSTNNSQTPTTPPQVRKQKKWGKWKKRMLLFLFGLSTGAIIALHYVPGDILQDLLRDEADYMGLHMPKPSNCELSLLTGSGNIDGMHVFHPNFPDAIYSCENIQWSPDIFSALFSQRVRIKSINFNNVSLNLRRKKTGLLPIPLIEQKNNTPWTSIYSNLIQWAHLYMEKKSHSKKKSSRNSVTVQKIHLTGNSILFPDASSLDIESFSIDIDNFSSKPQSDQDIRINIHMRSIGNTILQCTASINSTGIHIIGSLKNFPSNVLTEDYFDLDGIKQLRPQGTFDLHFEHSVENSSIRGEVRLSSDNLTLNPEPQADDMMQHIAQRLQNLRNNNNRSFAWQISYAGESGNIRIRYHIYELFMQMIQKDNHK